MIRFIGISLGIVILWYLFDFVDEHVIREIRYRKMLREVQHIRRKKIS